MLNCKQIYFSKYLNWGRKNQYRAVIIYYIYLSLPEYRYNFCILLSVRKITKFKGEIKFIKESFHKHINSTFEYIRWYIIRTKRSLRFQNFQGSKHITRRGREVCMVELVCRVHAITTPHYQAGYGSLFEE